MTATVLTTERLVLAPFSDADAPFIVRLLNEPSFRRNIGDKGVRSPVDARRYLAEGPVRSYDEHGFGLWRVSLGTASDPIGMCGLLRREGIDDVEVGFAFLPEHWGRGYALEAARASVAYGFDTLGLERIAAVATPDNASSIRLLDKLGFRFERRLRLAAGDDELALYRRAAGRAPAG